MNNTNSLTNCYLSSKYGVDDFYQFWMDNDNTSTDPFIKNLLFLKHHADQCLTDIDLREQLLTNAELEQQLLENEAILALDAQIADETAAQMVRQNSDWLDASIERANAQFAEANFQVLEDSLDASVELEISNHLQQMDWTDWELSNQISHLHKEFIPSKRGGFSLTSGPLWGEGGRSGNGGSGGKGFGGGGGQPPSFGPEPDPAFSLGRLLFYCFVGIFSYLAYQWAKVQIRKELAHLLLECQQQEQATPTAPAMRPKHFFFKKIILLTCGACFDPRIFFSALRLLTPLWLSQAIRASIPSIFRAVFSSVFSFLFSVVSPIIQTLGFGAILYLAHGAIGWLVPLAQPLLASVEGFFIYPMGESVAFICVSKHLKILSLTFWFGTFSGRLIAVYKKNKIVFLSLAIMAAGIFTLIWNNPTFDHQATSYIMARPFLGRLFDNQLGQFGLVFFGIVFLKSANFSIYTFALYLSLIYSSRIHKDIGDLPFYPQY